MNRKIIRRTIEVDNTRTCITCGETKSESEFSSRFRSCKTCINKKRNDTIAQRKLDGTTGMSKYDIQKKKYEDKCKEYTQYFEKTGVWICVKFKYGMELFNQTKNKLKTDGFHFDSDNKTWDLCIDTQELANNFIKEYFNKHQWSNISITNVDDDYLVKIDVDGGYLGDIVYEDIETILNSITI